MTKLDHILTSIPWIYSEDQVQQKTSTVVAFKDKSIFRNMTVEFEFVMPAFHKIISKKLLYQILTYPWIPKQLKIYSTTHSALAFFFN